MAYRRGRAALAAIVGLFAIAPPALASAQAGRETSVASSEHATIVVGESYVINNSSNLGAGGGDENFLEIWLDGTNGATFYGGQYEWGWPYGTEFDFCGYNNGTAYCTSPSVSVDAQGTSTAYVWNQTAAGSSSSTWLGQLYQNGYEYNISNANWSSVNGVNPNNTLMYLLSWGSFGDPQMTDTTDQTWEHVRYVNTPGTYGNWFTSDWSSSTQDSDNNCGRLLIQGFDSPDIANGDTSSGNEIACVN